MVDYNRNPEGLGGFKKYPDHINRAGRPSIDGVTLLIDALKKAKDDPAMGDLVMHAVKKAFTSDVVLNKILDKILPALNNLKAEGTITIADLMEVIKKEAPNEEEKK